MTRCSMTMRGLPLPSSTLGWTGAGASPRQGRRLRRQPLTLHGLIYGLTDGVLNDLEIELERAQAGSVFRQLGIPPVKVTKGVSDWTALDKVLLSAVLFCFLCL